MEKIHKYSAHTHTHKKSLVSLRGNCLVHIYPLVFHGTTISADPNQNKLQVKIHIRKTTLEILGEMEDAQNQSY